CARGYCSGIYCYADGLDSW
nr:immunoglobulin heavy chain junction region [Macaca mulatta]MOV46839.1 immunoglobulin heavy chain junction region [Macaca mulatta]